MAKPGEIQVSLTPKPSSSLSLSLHSCYRDQRVMTTENQVQEETKVLKFKTILADKENVSRPTGAKII